MEARWAKDDDAAHEDLGTDTSVFSVAWPCHSFIYGRRKTMTRASVCSSNTLWLVGQKRLPRGCILILRQENGRQATGQQDDVG